MSPRTYSHLRGLGRRPTDYDIATTSLLYHPARGFEVETPMAAWHHRHGAGSALRHGPDGVPGFADPARMHYTRYVDHRHEQEVFVDGVLAQMDATGYDDGLDAAWIDTLDGLLGALRFPIHGLQMVIAYAGSLAPSGRVVVAATMQAADELRRIQRIAYRMAQLRRVRPDFGDRSRGAWQQDEAWQPLRRLVEELLVTWDWGEALFGLDHGVKPLFDALFTVELGRLAARRGDPALQQILLSLAEDCDWHRAWSGALAEALVAEDAANLEVIAAWSRRWRDRAREALEPLLPRFAGAEAAALAAALDRVEEP